MIRRRFPASAKMTEGDFNAIHERTEEGLADLIYALATSNTDAAKLIFTNDPVTASADPGPWDITIPETYFAIEGIVGKLPATVINDITSGSTSNQVVAIFLTLERADSSEVRGVLGGTTASVVVQQSWVAGYEVVLAYTGPGDDPAAGVNDVGDPIKLAELTIASGALTVDHDADSLGWVVPAIGSPPDHASDHLTGGGDAIQIADASQEGLMSAEGMQTVLASLTNLSVNAASPFLVRTITGDNDPTPKTVELLLRVLADNFTTVTDGGVQKLALNFKNGGIYGTSTQPARADHKHALAESPIQLYSTIIDITDPSTQLGTTVQITIPTTFAFVTSVEFFWLAPTITSPYYPLVNISWDTILSSGSSKKVGARYTLAGARDVRVRVGDHALCELTSDELALTLTRTGTQTWDSVGGSSGLLPTTGQLVMIATGVRSGLSSL